MANHGPESMLQAALEPWVVHIRALVVRDLLDGMPMATVAVAAALGAGSTLLPLAGVLGDATQVVRVGRSVEVAQNLHKDGGGQLPRALARDNSRDVGALRLELVPAVRHVPVLARRAVLQVPGGLLVGPAAVLAPLTLVGVLVLDAAAALVLECAHAEALQGEGTLGYHVQDREANLVELGVRDDGLSLPRHHPPQREQVPCEPDEEHQALVALREVGVLRTTMSKVHDQKVRDADH
mmetsp:Transcript_43027/g.116003  ORF Transcript_43027/g.116003 Transcript_43027/m.116003 type:complete len:238 (-) Transcript_43027:623-1336(-)